MPCPPRRTVSLQTTCQVIPGSLKSLLVGATVIAMRLGRKTGVHCIQHGSRPLDVRLSGSISCCCCPLSWPLSPPQNSQSKRGGVYLTHLQSFSPESTPHTATHRGPCFWPSHRPPGRKDGTSYLQRGEGRLLECTCHMLVGSRCSEVPKELKPWMGRVGC